MRRRLLLFAAALLGVLVLAAGVSVGWLIATESGARFVLARLAVIAPQVSFESASGRLNDALSIRGLSISGDGYVLEVDQVRTELALAGLLRGQLEIERLQVGSARFASIVLPGGPTSAPSLGFSLPVGIVLRRASIESIRIDRGEDVLEIDRVILSLIGTGQTVRVQRLETTWQNFFVSIQGGIDWRSGLALDLLASWSGLVGGESWLGSAAVEGTWPRLTVEQELLEPYRLATTGELIVAAEPTFDLEVAFADTGAVSITGGYQADQERWQAALETPGLETGTIVAGLPDAVVFDGVVWARLGEDLAIGAENISFEAVLGSQRLAGSVSGALDSSRAISIDALELAYGDNRVAVTGRVADRVALDLTAELNDLAVLVSLLERYEIDTALIGDLAALLDGQVSVGLALTGAARSPEIAGTIRVDNASIVGLPLAALVEFAQADGAGTAGLLRIERFDSTLGSSHVAGSGSLSMDFIASGDLADGAIALTVSAEAPDLAELARAVTRLDIESLDALDSRLASLAGSGQVTVDIGGSLARPDLDGRVGLASLSVDGWTLDRAAVDAAVGLYPGGSGDFALELEAADFGLMAVAAGRVADNGWSGSLTEGTVEASVGGVWRMESASPVTVTATRVSIESACLVNAASRVCASLQRSRDVERLTVRATDFELAILNPLLPPNLAMSGRVAIDASFDSASALPRGELTAFGRNIALGIELGNDEGSTTLLDSVAITGSLDGFAVLVDASIQSNLGGLAQVSMSLADLRDPDSMIEGRLDIAWPDLAAAALLSPEVGEVGGTLEVGIDVSGSVQSPEISGNAALGAGRVSVPEWGVLVEGIEARALSFDGGSLEFDGVGYIEDGEIRLSGTTELDPVGGWPTRLRVTGNNLPIARSPDAVVYATPDFEATIVLPVIEVTGSVLIPTAEISVDELPPQAVTVSPDSIVHGEVAEDVSRPLEISAEVTVELGDEVRYAGAGLNADLSGGLRLSYRSGVSPVANGSLSLSGTYEAFGQELTLDRGELLFAGPLDNPTIDVLAVRRIGTTTVGVRLSGTLEATTPTIFSDPQMSEANALSYLMLGRPLSTTNDAEAATLESTALALGLQQALPAVQRVGETLGLDELSIEPTDLDSGSLMAGKYLSPKVYMSYTYGLFNRLGGFLLRYSINERLRLETRSGNESSMDLLYSIEKE